MTRTLYLVVMLGVIVTITLVSVPSLFTKKCQNCGIRNWLEAKKCRKCGAPFSEET